MTAEQKIWILREHKGVPDIRGLSFDDRLGLLFECDVTVREDRRLTRLLRHAKLRLPASIEDLDLRSPCGLDRFYHPSLRQLRRGPPS